MTLELLSNICKLLSKTELLEIVKFSNLQCDVFTTNFPQTTVIPQPIPTISTFEAITNGSDKMNIPGPSNTFLIFPLLTSTSLNFATMSSVIDTFKTEPSSSS